MSCIWTTLEPGNHIIVFCKIINDFSFSFIAPLQAKYYIYRSVVSHIFLRPFWPAQKYAVSNEAAE